MPRDIVSMLALTSRRLAAKLGVNIIGAVCCNKGKEKEGEEKCEEIQVSATTAEPDWVRNFYKAELAVDEVGIIFQSDDEDDEDCNHQIQEPSPSMQPGTLPFKDSNIRDMYNLRPVKKQRGLRESRKRRTKTRQRPEETSSARADPKRREKTTVDTFGTVYPSADTSHIGIET